MLPHSHAGDTPSQGQDLGHTYIMPQLGLHSTLPSWEVGVISPIAVEREASTVQESIGYKFSYWLLTPEKGKACPCSSPLLCCLILLTNRKSIVKSKGTAGRGSQGLQQYGHLPWLAPLEPNVE